MPISTRQGRFRIHKEVVLYPLEDNPYLNIPSENILAPPSASNQTRRGQQNINTSRVLMTENNFNDFKEKIRLMNTDEERLQNAKAMIQQYGISSGQLAGLIDVFSFENTKLTLAKFAYPLLSDRENFSGIVNLFKYENSKRELEELMNK